MFLPVRPQTWGICLLSLIVGLVPFVSQSAPSLKNLNVTSAFENERTSLTSDVSNGGGGDMILRINWGDGTPLELYSMTSSFTNFVVEHVYADDNPTNTAVDLYTISLSVSNNTGIVTTNVGVPVQNVAPQLALTVTSPIEIGAPATLSGLNIREFALPTVDSEPHGITIGPDNNIWFTEISGDRIGRITTNGVITEFPVPANCHPAGIATGSDGRLWFCASGSQQIGAMTPAGVVTMYTIPRLPTEPLKTPQSICRRNTAMWFTDLSYRVSRILMDGTVTQFVNPAGENPLGIVVGADNNIWWTAYFTDNVNRLRVADGATNVYHLGFLATPALMTLGPDNAVWFTEVGSGTNAPGKIGRITTNGVITETTVGTTGPYGICVGPDGAIWFTESRRGSNSIGRLTLDGRLSRYGLAKGSLVTEIVTGPDSGLYFTLKGRDRIGRIRYQNQGNVVLSGELNDPGNLDTHFVQINWGDGSAIQTFSLPAGIASFHTPHTYSGLQPNYVITVTATDDDTGLSQATATVAVNHPRFTSLTCSPGTDVRIKGQGATGRTITIESSTDLQNWSSVRTVNSVSNAFEFVHPNPTGVKRFYRGKLP